MIGIRAKSKLDPVDFVMTLTVEVCRKSLHPRLECQDDEQDDEGKKGMREAIPYENEICCTVKSLRMV